MSTSSKTDWWFRFFNHQDYLDIYRDMTGPERTQREIGFCDRVLGWIPGQKILDAPCGAGRHVLELSNRGHAVVGLDASRYLLDQAQRGLEQTHGPALPHFVRGLLQAMPFREGSFDFVICLFSSFGYGETTEENLNMMREFRRVLRPGGKVLVDVMNRHFIVPRLNTVYESIQSGLRVREERAVIEGGRRLHNHIQVTDREGNRRSYLYRPWLYNGWELSWMAAQAGLHSGGVYGNFWGDPYQQTSERAMLVATRPGK